VLVPVPLDPVELSGVVVEDGLVVVVPELLFGVVLVPELLFGYVLLGLVVVPELLLG
jgi:hypothetical protein